MVYNHLMRLGIETLLAVPPNSGNQNEIALDRELFNAIRLNLDADVRAAVDRHHCKTTKELWEALETENSAMNQSRVVDNLKFVTGTKLQSLKNLAEHCMKFSAAIHQLKQTGRTFNETCKVDMFLATVSNHSQFYIHVQTHIHHNRYDLTQTFLHCQREASAFLNKATSQVAVGNINKSARYANNNNAGWNNYSDLSRGNRLNQKNKKSNKFRPNDKPPFNHMKRRRDQYGNNNSSNNSNNDNSNYRSNSNSYNNWNRSSTDNRSNQNNRQNSGHWNSNSNSSNSWRPRNQSNVRSISNQPANEEASLMTIATIGRDFPEL